MKPFCREAISVDDGVVAAFCFPVKMEQEDTARIRGRRAKRNFLIGHLDSREAALTAFVEEIADQVGGF
jgi:hypothetical protein